MIASASLASTALTKRASSALISASSAAPARTSVEPQQIVSAGMIAIEIPVMLFIAAPFSPRENSDVAVTMLLAEIDYLFFSCGGVGFRIDKHQMFGGHIVDSVGLDVKIVVVADNKCHLNSSPRTPHRIRFFP